MKDITKISILLAVIGVVIFAVIGIGNNSESEALKIHLDISKLPSNWSVGKVKKIAAKKSLNKYSEKFGGKISRLEQYLLNAEGTKLFIMFIKTKTKQEANKVYKYLISNGIVLGKDSSYKKINDKIIIYEADDNFKETDVVTRAKELNLITKRPNKFAGDNELSKKESLLKDYSSISLANQNFLSFKLLNQAIKKNQIFLTGEIHGIAMNSKLKFKFLKYFKKQADIKYYLCELPYSATSSLNKYLQTGNKEILNNLFLKLKKSNYDTKGNYEFWNKFYKFNSSLSEEERIKVVCIDITHYVNYGIGYLNSLLSSCQNPPSNIAPLITELKNHSIITSKKTFFKRLNKSLQKNYEAYHKLLGDKAFEFKLVTENILTTIKRDRLEDYQEVTKEKLNKIRDQQIYENFKKLYSRLPKGKYYGQWGLNHVYQSSQSGVDWFASLLDSPNSPVQGEVLSIPYYYNNSKLRAPGLEQTYKFISNYSAILKLNSITDQKLTLFKVPQNKSSVLYKPPGAGQGELSDYYQYLVLVQNGKASTDWSLDSGREEEGK